VNETWGEHWVSTMKYSCILLGLFFISIIHAFIPIIFTKTLSNKLRKIQDDILYRSYADEPEFIKLMKENVKRIR
jgi:hypothetical protein